MDIAEELASVFVSASARTPASAHTPALKKTLMEACSVVMRMALLALMIAMASAQKPMIMLLVMPSAFAMLSASSMTALVAWSAAALQERN